MKPAPFSNASIDLMLFTLLVAFVVLVADTYRLKSRDCKAEGHEWVSTNKNYGAHCRCGHCGTILHSEGTRHNWRNGKVAAQHSRIFDVNREDASESDNGPHRGDFGGGF